MALGDMQHRNLPIRKGRREIGAYPDVDPYLRMQACHNSLKSNPENDISLSFLEYTVDPIEVDRL